jgi:hypothetical protein
MSVKAARLAVALMLAAASASAQQIHTEASLDGQKSFSDQPDPAPEAAPATGARRTPAGTMAKGSKGAALVNSNEAQRRLAQVQRKRQQALAPLPNEKVQGSRTQVDHRYWMRQEKMRREVEQAQRRSNETRQLQLAQR